LINSFMISDVQFDREKRRTIPLYLAIETHFEELDGIR
jgi:hypothetical protein